MRPSPDLRCYLVTGSGTREHLLEVVREAVAGGCGTVQVRSKPIDALDLYELTADIAREVGDRATVLVDDRVDVALAHGVREDQIIVDPGHDLNKTTVHTLELTRRLGEVAGLGHPVLAAVSNKDFVGESLDRAKPDRLAGSLAAAVASVFLGARIVRMHDARAAVDAARMVEAILGWRRPVHAVHNVS